MPSKRSMNQMDQPVKRKLEDQIVMHIIAYYYFKYDQVIIHSFWKLIVEQAHELTPEDKQR